MQNIVIQCGTNNISTDFPCHIADCIVDVGIIFVSKSITVNIINWSSILRDNISQSKGCR